MSIKIGRTTLREISNGYQIRNKLSNKDYAELMNMKISDFVQYKNRNSTDRLCGIVAKFHEVEVIDNDKFKPASSAISISKASGTGSKTEVNNELTEKRRKAEEYKENRKLEKKWGYAI